LINNNVAWFQFYKRYWPPDYVRYERNIPYRAYCQNLLQRDLKWRSAKRFELLGIGDSAYCGLSVVKNCAYVCTGSGLVVCSSLFEGGSSEIVGSLAPVSAMEPRHLLLGHYNGSLSIFCENSRYQLVQLHNQAISAIHVRDRLAYVATVDGFLFLYCLESKICQRTVHVSEQRIIALQTTEENTTIIITPSAVISLDANFRKVSEIPMQNTASVSACMCPGLVGMGAGHVYKLQSNELHQIVEFTKIMSFDGEIVGISDRYVVTLSQGIARVISLDGKILASMMAKGGRAVGLFHEDKLLLLTRDSLSTLDI
jgi:hypothetical protein